MKTDSRALTGHANRPERSTQQQCYGLRLNTAGSVPCPPARCSFDWRSFVAVGAAIGHIGCTMLLSDDDLARARREQPVEAIDSKEMRADVDRAAGDARALRDAGPDASVQSSPPGVVVISVDGLASRFLQAEIEAGRAPAFEALQRDAAFTHNARTEARNSVTLPNHTSMITGRPAVLVPELPTSTHHGLLDNYDLGGEHTIHDRGNPDLAYAASVFDEAHDRGGYTALFSGKSKFELMQRSYAALASRPDLIEPDDGADKIDDFLVLDDSSSLVSEFLRRVELGVAAHPWGPNVAMLHLRDTDSEGHAYGWGSEEYSSALRLADSLVGRVVEALRVKPGLSRTWLIVTTDHGGVDNGHFDTAALDVVQIPFYVWGPGVAAGADLYELTSGTRVDPGEAIPMDGTGSQPIRNGDVANLALWLLGLPPIDGSLHRGMKLGAADHP